ncbi:MAG: 2-dehydropantoate 2-reductase [Anaerolineales bacterium]|nr:2-dehydropantoate 2-reductase [Anaerolineales bacterium]MCX7609319.1 2-dehydropantoate 2-reductase [Anaerolineales bacterium]MDW8226390.1 2-dehydropantoate 2-reductase [Anaerolineales bacterium]
MTSILIVGTGALATLFAARLARAGLLVTMLGGWREALDALAQGGAQIEGHLPQPVRTTDNPASCAPTKLALVLVKSWQTDRAADCLATCLAPDGFAITFQNGLGNLERLQAALGAERVAAGVTTLGATLLAPAVVRLAGEGTLWLEETARLEEAATLLTLAGFRVERVPDIRPRQWGKLLINAAINPLTAVLRVPNGALLTDPHAHAILVKLVEEATQVAAAQGISLPFADPLQAVEEVARQTAENLSSMLRDVLRNAPTEIDAITGQILRFGAQSGVATPCHQQMYEFVQKRTTLSSTLLYDMLQ